MKIGLIDIGWKEINEDTFTTQALGGSETWLLSVAKELTKAGHQVDIYCNTDHYWSSDFGLENVNENKAVFIPLYNIIDNFLTLYSNNTRYDFVVLNRIIYRFRTDIITLIRQYNVTDNIFIQMHDLSLLYEDHLATEQELQHSGIFDKRVRGIVFLTEWHKTNFEHQYPVLNSIPKFIIPNGVDLSLIPSIKPEPDHRILWSSCAERGLNFLLNMYDEIRAQVPDFGIDIAGYNDLPNFEVGDRDIRVLGNLSKEQLYQEMNKHGVWFYPGTFAETFCITMIENMACGNMIISPFTYGTQDVAPYLYRTEMQNAYGTIDRFDNYYPAVKHKAVAAIVKALTNYKPNLAEKGREIAKKYTWFNTAKSYVDLFDKLLCRNIPIQHKYKGIFLSQSANLDFFKRESEVVEETWAKTLIEGKHPGYTYFRYTSCDEQHPEPCIDGHIIYVVNDDTSEQTYEKMRDMYRLLLEQGYDFDFIFRTNTSTYVNVKKAIEAIESCNVNEIKADICGWYIIYPNGERHFQYNTFIGYAYIMSRTIADRIFLSGFDSSWENTIPKGDDIVATSIINELTNPGELIYTILNPTGCEHFDLCPRYKHILDPVHETNEEQMSRYTTDPNVVNQWVTVGVRTFHPDIEKRIENNEIEHLRELHQAYESAL